MSRARKYSDGKRHDDLAGQRFGLLTITERARTAWGEAGWRAVCDCGKEILSATSEFKRGRRTSCGCATKHHEKGRRAVRKSGVPQTRKCLPMLPAEAYPDVERPRTRADCIDGPRPCPWTSCRHHLWSDVDRHGHIIAHPCEPEEMPARRSCALDVVDDEGSVANLEDIGAILGVSRERVRQIETMALRKLQRSGIDPEALRQEHAPSAADALDATPGPTDEGGGGTFDVSPEYETDADGERWRTIVERAYERRLAARAEEASKPKPEASTEAA